jgi:hypothetical protein
MHLLSPKAVELAGALFREFGTLYPLEITGAANGWVLFNPTNVVDCLNLSASRVKRLPFRPDEIYAIDVPVFHEDKVPREGMFIVPECPHGDIYVCENVRQRVEQLALRGFVLKTSRSAKNIWISEFVDSRGQPDFSRLKKRGGAGRVNPDNTAEADEPQEAA